MGADARIHIWPEAALREAWPSCDDLFRAMDAEIAPCRFHRYTNELGGQRYVHIYEGSGAGEDWTQVCQRDEWDQREPMTEAQLDQFLRLRTFVRWLKAHATVWEVWT